MPDRFDPRPADSAIGPARSGRHRERMMGQHVWEFIKYGFHEAPAAAAAILADPWGHVYAWLTKEIPTPADLRPLLFHLEALSKDRFFPRQKGLSFSPADFEALARQLAEFLHDLLFREFSRNRAVEALLHRDYERGLSHIAQPRKVARLLALLQVVNGHVTWPEVSPSPELGHHLERVLKPNDEPASDRDPAISARITASVLHVLGLLWSGSLAAISIPLAGEYPSVVWLRLSCTFPSEDPPTGALAAPPNVPVAAGTASAPRRRQIGRWGGDGGLETGAAVELPAVEWLGLPVAPDVSNGLRDLLGSLDRLLPTIPMPSRLNVFVTESRHRPLNRAVRLMAGRSWELGGVFALLMAVSGGTMDRVAATGQVNWSTGRLESITGIEDKVEALYACRHPEGGPIVDQLFCPLANVGAAERVARRLGWADLTVHGVASVDELLDLCGPDPWQKYCQELIARAERERPQLGADAHRIADFVELLHSGERVVAVPSPFGVDSQMWCRQIAAEVAKTRLDRIARPLPGTKGTAWRGVPVILGDDPDAPTFGALIARAVTEYDPKLSEQTWSNTYQTPDGFFFLHADPHNLSPLLTPSGHSPVFLLSRRHQSYRHRFCFVADNLHHLESWQSHPILSRL